MNETRVIAAANDGSASGPGLTVGRLRMMVQDSHLNFLIGAGTPSAFFGKLGNVEDALTELAASDAPEPEKALVRASINGYFFETVLAPNLRLIARDATAEPVLRSYERFLRTLNRILLKRRSSLLGKQVNIFTTNVDMAFEVALESLAIDVADGFNGKMRPKFDLGEFGTLKFRQASRYGNRSEIPVVNLYKIHGSAGWRFDPREADRADIYFDHGLTSVEAIDKLYLAAKAGLLRIGPTLGVKALLDEASGRTLSAEGDAFARAYANLAIVNPEKTKFAATVLNETYYELIRRFANELEKENSLLFVHGFSFRDEHLRDMVLRAARGNPTLQVVVFAYSRADKAAFETLMPELEVKNANILYVSPPEPTGAGDAGELVEDVLTLDRVEALYFAPLVPEESRKPDHVLEIQIAGGAERPADA